MTVVAKKERVRGKAFTLIELMVVVIIIGILAALAMPMFSRAIESTKAKEAVAALQQIRTGERIYRVEENTYFYSSGGGGLTETKQINETIRTFLDVRDDDKRNWDYSVGVGATAASTFTATATRKSGGAEYKDKTITIDEDGGLAGDWPLPLPAE